MDMLEQVTPVLLTFNEAENISRTLSRLMWARDIVVVDSGSTDGTISLLTKFAQVRVFTRTFDNHHNQWNYAVRNTSIATPWILRLDADYQVTGALVEEISQLDQGDAVDAYYVAFDYAIFSRKLISSLYPPKPVLLRKDRLTILDKGHTEGWSVQGPVKTLNARIIHDDWKSTEQWLNAQGNYMRREVRKLHTGRGRLQDWARLALPGFPIVVFLYCLFVKGLILNGRAGVFYALQRMVAEAVFSLIVLENKLREQSKTPSDLA
jgi:glycosyltransferase involved in cell wall biosynthesis